MAATVIEALSRSTTAELALDRVGAGVRLPRGCLRVTPSAESLPARCEKDLTTPPFVNQRLAIRTLEPDYPVAKQRERICCIPALERTRPQAVGTDAVQVIDERCHYRGRHRVWLALGLYGLTCDWRAEPRAGRTAHGR